MGTQTMAVSQVRAAPDGKACQQSNLHNNTSLPLKPKPESRPWRQSGPGSRHLHTIAWPFQMRSLNPLKSGTPRG